MATLTVGSGKQYTTIAAAVAATRDGDTVLVQAGTYLNDFTTITHNITMQSVGGKALMLATVEPPNGKAILTADASAVIDGFAFAGAVVGDGNGAGIRYEAGNLVVRNSLFYNNQDGLLANPVANGTILIQNSEFSHNGAGDGYTHNLYVGAIASLVVQDSYFHDAVIGHEIKSRALSTTITGSRIQDNAFGTASYSIDLPNAGVALIQNNIIEKGANAPNWISIHYGGEGGYYAGSSLTVSNNTLVNDNANGYLLANQSAPGTVVALVNNEIWGYAADHIATGAVLQFGNTTLAARPTLDVSTLAPDVAAPPEKPPVIVTAVPAGVAYQTWGPAGAVVASGHVLTVGGKGQFATLGAALSAAVDGDTIKVAAGLYVNDFASVTHKVIIEGVGGIARFVQQNQLGAPGGILMVSADATLRNLEFSGASNYSGHEAGIEVLGGHVTIVNSYLHDNNIGLLATDNPDSTVSVYNSEIGPNGNQDKGTHNVSIGAIGSFTVQNSTIHGAIAGHEISDRAYFSDFEGNRIFDGAGIQASFLINLGQGGQAIIRNNVLAKGPDAENGILIHVGGEGPAYDNSDVQITGNTLVSDLQNSGHPYTFFIYGDAAAGAAPSVNATGNVFVGGVPGSQQIVNGTGSGNNVAASALIDVTSPVNPAAAAPMFAASGGGNKLKISLSETRGQLDAQAVIYVDGVAVGSTIVTANHGTDPSQVFTIAGWWGVGARQVTVTAVNLTGSVAAQALYIDGVALDDAAIAPGQTLTGANKSYTTLLPGTTRAPDFDPNFYLSHNADVKAAGINPLQHYLTYGYKENRNPNALFDSEYYLTKNPDVRAAGVNPLLHFEQYGWREGRDPSPYFSVARYLAANPAALVSADDPLYTFLNSGAAPANPAVNPYALPEASLFDATYYLAHNPDVAAAHIDPLAHYNVNGWREGRDPSASFSTNKYFAAYLDVKGANIDPLAHYAEYGMHEGRLAFAV